MDLNGDGKLDILSGSYSRQGGSMAGLFQVLWGTDTGFKKAQPLKGADDRFLIISADDQQKITRKICTRPTAADWDGDGDLDLVVGNFEGSFFLFRGEAGGKFDPVPEVMKCEGRELRVGGGAHSDPFVVDWDGDGDLDLLSGSSNGGVEWAENKAGADKEPELRPFTSLIPAPGYGKAGKDEPSDSTRVWVEDFNADGKLDLIVGDKAIIQRPAKGLSEAEMLEKKTAWEKASAAIQEEMNKGPGSEDGRPDKELMKKFRKHYETRKEFMTEERTGFVWVYLRK